MRLKSGYFPALFTILLLSIVSLSAVEHSGTIGTETWMGSYTHYITGTVTVPDGETLTIEPGATIRFSPSTSLIVYGKLVADGTSVGEILFSSGQTPAQAGDWGQISFLSCDPGTVLDHCIVEYGGNGSGMLYIHNCGENISITNSSFNHANGSGAFIHDQSTAPSEPSFISCSFASNSVHGLDAGSNLSLPYVQNCSFTSNLQYGMSVFTGGLSRVSGSINMSSNGTNAIYARASDVGTGTWYNVGVPCYLSGNFNVIDGSTLTIQAGSDLRFTGNYYMMIYGKLIANGTSGNHIVFTSADTTPGAGDWQYIYFNGSDPGSVLNWCDFSYGGHSNGTIYFHNNNTDVTVSNCTITNSGNAGIALNDYSTNPSTPIITNTTISNCGGAGIDCSGGMSLPWVADCAFNNNGSYAMKLFSTGLNRITGTNTGTGNNPQAILAMGGDVTTGTWHNFFLPFYFSNATIVADGETLTIEPGTQMRFTNGASLKIDGALVADGTESEHITFTSASTTPAPGDWQYIYFYRADAGTSLSWCDIMYGGSSNGNLNINGCPNNMTVTNCTITNSAQHGVYINDYYESQSNVSFTNCEFNNNTLMGLDTSSGVSQPYITDCSFHNNGSYAARVWATYNSRVTGTIDMSGNNPDGINLIGGAVDTSTWHNFGYPYYMGGSVTVNDGQTLTIEEGSEFLFTGNYNLTIEGCLIADGTPEEHIVFTSAQATPSPGDWTYIYFHHTDAGALLDYCDISYSGNSYGSVFVNGSPNAFTISNCTVTNSGQDGIYLYDYYESSSVPSISNCEFSNNTGQGLNAGGGVSFPTIDNCSFLNNGSYAMTLWGNSVHLMSDTQTISGNSPNGINVLGASIGTCTWYNHDAPYYIGGSLTVSNAATLTLEPGVEFLFNGNYDLRIDGALIADGTPEEHIVFTSAQETPTPGFWRFMYFYQADEGTMLDYCDISYGGSSSGLVYIHNGPNNFPITNCTITNSATTGVRISDYYTAWSYPTFENCLISGNAEYGVDCSSGGSNPFFNNCTITGNGFAPLLIWGYNIDRVAEDNTLTGNGFNWIRVLGSDITNSTFRNHDIPYSFNGTCNLQDEGVVTVEPGTELKFDDGTGLNVYGTFVAEGTESEPITFTTNLSTPAPGGWRGLYFESTPEGTSLDYCVVSYAGDCGANIYVNSAANVAIDHSAVTWGSQDGIYCSDYYANPSTMTVANTTVSNNANYGLDLTGGGSNVTITDCTIQANAYNPILLYPYQVTHLEGTMTFGGNGEEMIRTTSSNIYNGTWHNFGIPYLMTSSNTVLADQTLTIEPGCTLLFADDIKLIINGNLIANGTESEHIVFDSAQNEPSAGDWQCLFLQSCTAASSIKYCDFANGGGADAMLRLSGSGDVEVSDCTFTNSSLCGIMVHDQYYGPSSATIHDCEVQNAGTNGIGLYVTSGQNIYDCYLHDCQIGLYNSGGSNLFTHGNVVTGNSAYGIQLNSNASLVFGGDMNHWNDIYNNGTYNFYNGNADIDARFVYWGSTDQSAIEAGIYDETDSPSLGLVNFWPYLDQAHQTQYNQSLDAPINVSISATQGSTTISWSAVTGATFYRVYASEDPFADFSQWTLKQDNITATTWNDPLTQTSTYYRIVACSE